MRRRGAWVMALVPLLASGAAPARAQPVPPTSDVPAAAAPVVELIVVGGGPEAPALLDTMRDLLGRVGLVLEAHAVATPAEVASDSPGLGPGTGRGRSPLPGEAVIVTEGRRQAPKQRTLRRNPSPSIAREELAQAIQSGVEAQLFADPEGRVTPPAVEGAPGADVAPPARGAATPAGLPPDAPAPAPSLPPPPPDAPPDAPLALPVPQEAAGVAEGPPGPGGRCLHARGRRMVRERQWAGGRAGRRRHGRGSQGMATFAHAVGARGPPVRRLGRLRHGSRERVRARALAGLEVVHTPWFALVAGAGGGADVCGPRPAPPCSRLPC